MQVKAPLDLGKRIHLIDGFDLGMPARTGTYVIREADLTIVETGPTPSVPYILQGLDHLGLSPQDIKYIIVTHIHLDHAGGAGVLLKECPHAQVVVHPRGKKHLSDPSRLIAGARAVYGDQFDRLFGFIEPVPADRLVVKGDGDGLQIGPKCTLSFLDTPGHAKHHFSIYDPVSKGMFTGDTVGIRYQALQDQGVDFFLPSTSPNQFDPQAMLDSIERIQTWDVERMYYGHFGMAEQVHSALGQAVDWLDVFVDEGKKVFQEYGDRLSDTKGMDQAAEELAHQLLLRVQEQLSKQHIPDDHQVYEVIKLDLRICSMGIIDFLVKEAQKNG